MKKETIMDDAKNMKVLKVKVLLETAR